MSGILFVVCMVLIYIIATTIYIIAFNKYYDLNGKLWPTIGITLNTIIVGILPSMFIYACIGDWQKQDEQGKYILNSLLAVAIKAIGITMFLIW